MGLRYKKVIKILVSGFFVCCSFIFVPEVIAGNCDYSWQTAKNGTRCGNRAASVKRGSKVYSSPQQHIKKSKSSTKSYKSKPHRRR